MSKLHIKKGDMVFVNAGDNRGQQGKVLSVDAAKQRAIVEGVNICKKATKPNAKNPQGGLVHELTVDGVLNLTSNGNHNGLLHLVADNQPNTLFSKISFHNGN